MHRRSANNRNPSKKGKKKPGKARKAKWSQQISTASTLSGPFIAPDELDTKLRFRDFVSITNAGGGFASKEYRPNAAYDIDPSLGSTETYGFDEYAALYTYYRVVGFSYKITCANKEFVPVNLYLLNTNKQPSTVGTNFLLYSSNPYCSSKLVSQTGGISTHTFSGHIKYSRLLGSNNVETADSFRALTTGVPTDTFWLAVGAESSGGSLATGVSLDVTLTLHVRFYGREVDLSLAGMQARMKHISDSRAQWKLAKQLASSRNPPAAH